MWQRKIQLYQIKCKGRNSLKTLHLSLFFFKYIISEYTAQFIENNVAYFVLCSYQAIIYGIILCVMFANAL